MPSFSAEQLRQLSATLQNYLLSCDSKNGLPVVNSAEDDQRKVIIRQHIKPLLTLFMDSKVPLASFKSQLDGINKKDNLWGFTGFQGQMFFNQLVKAAADQKRLAGELRVIFPAPTNDDDAARRMNTFLNYVKTVGIDAIAKGVPKASVPKTSSVPFFVSFFWQVEQPGNWPIFYKSSTDFAKQTGLIQCGTDVVANYLSYKRLFHRIAAAFEQEAKQKFDLYAVEHAFWINAHDAAQSAETTADANDSEADAEEASTMPALIANLNSICARTKNVLLYGPPGTGKTFYVQKFAEVLQKHHAAGAPSQEQASLEVLKDTRWYDAIALAMYLAKKPTLKVAEILETPVMHLLAKIKTHKTVRNTIWGQLQSHTHPDVQTVRVTNRVEPFLFSKRHDSSWELTPEGRQYIETELADEIAVLTGKAKPQAETKNVRFVTFHQSFAYEEFIEGLKPLPPEKTNGSIQYDIQPGIFKQIATDARLAYEAAPDKANAPKFLLIIDEINRANIAKVFGELITLIEDDKRLGQPNALSVTLPYSQQQFAVPPNLYLLGTLNTADRSIAQLDLALRRRFAFVQMPPDYALFQGDFASHLAGVPLAALLQALNKNIATLLDPDHQIGHAYLLFKTKDLPDEAAQRDALHFAFTHKILPLLQEYFHNDSPRLHRCLGNAFFTAASIDPADADFSPHTYHHTLKHLSPTELPQALRSLLPTASS